VLTFARPNRRFSEKKKKVRAAINIRAEMVPKRTISPGYFPVTFSIRF